MRKLILFTTLIFAAQMSFAQVNFVWSDVYEWMDKGGVDLVETIDKVVQGNGNRADQSNLSKSLRTSSARFGNVAGILNRNQADVNKKAVRFASADEYATIYRNDPKFVEVDLNNDQMNVIVNNSKQMRQIFDDFRSNRYQVTKGEDNYSANKDLLKKYKSLYKEIKQILESSQVN